ncbi:hypothetical protein FG05_35366 [Fusarium graminearum]|nr:hypothetical protein FG05_35366 [Fusarium graminearum]
MKDLHENHPLY